MHPLAATMPTIEVPRHEIVETRLARKIGPLFGVVWEQNPYGCTWVCDYPSLTLAEVARGAPFPSRATQAALDREADRQVTSGATGMSPAAPDGVAGAAGWQPADRAIWTYKRRPPPTALANATVGRYGPDTKAAVVLAGANRLLLDVTQAITSVCGQLHNSGVRSDVRLAVWTGLVLEAHRGQPALVNAAVQARAVQRALTSSWPSGVGRRGLTGAARCEINAPDEEADGESAAAGGSSIVPKDLSLLDGTFPKLLLPAHTDELSIVEALCRRMLQVGSPGAGSIWLHERPPRHRTVLAYLDIPATATAFVAAGPEQLRADATETARRLAAVASTGRPAPGLIPDLPPAGQLLMMPRTTQRAHVLAAYYAVSYLRAQPEIDRALNGQPTPLAMLHKATWEAQRRAVDLLGADDPAALLAAGYHNATVVWDLCREGAVDQAVELPGRCAELVKRQHDTVALWRRHGVDGGTAAYVLGIGAQALERAERILGAPVAEAGSAADDGGGSAQWWPWIQRVCDLADSAESVIQTTLLGARPEQLNSPPRG